MITRRWMFRSVGGVLLVVLLPACHNPKRAALDLEQYKGTIKVACVGDSITYGAGLPDRDTQSYPAVLGKLLGSRYEVRNFGVSGATLLKQGDKPYWTQPEFEAVAAFGPQVVIIKLGTNDSKPQNWAHQAEFEADYEALLDHFARLSSRPRVWICLPVPVYETRWGISDGVVHDEVIPRIRKAAHHRGVPIIDLYETLSERPQFFPDKVHPNADGARLMAQTVHDALVAR
jgi:acyl-CoA thioesterase I